MNLNPPWSAMWAAFLYSWLCTYHLPASTPTGLSTLCSIKEGVPSLVPKMANKCGQLMLVTKTLSLDPYFWKSQPGISTRTDERKRDTHSVCVGCFWQDSYESTVPINFIGHLNDLRVHIGQKHVFLIFTLVIWQNLAESGIFSQISPDLPEYARFCQIHEHFKNIGL